MTHRRLDLGAGEPVRVVLVGAGGMGRAWLRAIGAEPGARLAGVVDLDLGAAREAAATAAGEVAVGTDAVALARETDAHAVIDVTVPEAHHPVTTACLAAGLPVLGEKPVAVTVAQALSLCAATGVSGELFMVSQSRRWNPRLAALRQALAALAPVGLLTTHFARSPHFGGFREEMAEPLLVDMAIHAFDAARFVLGSEPVSVSCEAFDPPWSWYAGNAAAVATFAMSDGARYVYHGSWCAPGAQTSWNGEWWASAARGSVRWDGENAPLACVDEDHAGRGVGDAADLTEVAVPVADGPEDIGGALTVFLDALRTGVTPDGEVHGNVLSLAMVEAAVLSAGESRRVLLDEVLHAAHEDAVRDERRDDVRAVLESWTDLRGVLARED